MLTVDEALEKVRGHAVPLPPQRVPLADAAGRILAEEILADRDSPPFDKSLVDGYAVRSADFEAAGYDGELRVVEEIPAGKTPTRSLGAGECAAIMTGAPLPLGADAVVMVERTERQNDRVRFAANERIKSGQFRLTRGREMRAGEAIIPNGELLTPARLGLLATVGRTEVLLTPCPHVVIVPTGDELVEPDREPGPGQIRNSNATILRALVTAQGASARVTPIAPDEPEPLKERLQEGMSADVLLVTGGVSAGKRDLVPDTLRSLGMSEVFHKIRLRPGKPLLFGVGPERPGGLPGPLIFGLPGNPVSGIVGFLLFVRPALDILARRKGNGAALLRQGRLAKPYTHNGDRPTYHPARWQATGPGEATIEPLDWAGSADLRAVASADGFASFAAGDRTYEAGEMVSFLSLLPES
jgi:molybdopterin molybdotransferase